jgi:hypothetical protein
MHSGTHAPPRLAVALGLLIAAATIFWPPSVVGAQVTATAAGASHRPTRAAIRAHLLAVDRRSHDRAPRILLDHFAVFSADALDHRGASVAVSRPLLSSLPFQVLELASPKPSRRIDIHQIRQVKLGNGIKFWVVAGGQGLCLFSQDLPRNGEAFGSCTANLAHATSRGNSINLRLRNGKRIVAGVVPDTNQTLRARKATGAIKSVPVIDGVYVVPAGLRHISIKSVFATP